MLQNRSKIKYFPLYIASRWTSSVPQKHTQHILRLGIACIAFCMALIVIAICVLVGFKQEITQKVYGFGSHLQIIPYPLNTDSIPGLDLQDPAIEKLNNCKLIKRWDTYLHKEGLLKGQEESLGVLFKGLDRHFDTLFFADKLIEGRLPFLGEEISNEIIISRKTAQTLKLKLGDKARTYFIVEDYLRPRAFQIVGIYETGLENFDATYMLGDMRQIQRLLNWDSHWVGGIDINLYDPAQRTSAQRVISDFLPYQWSCYTSDAIYTEIFDWLALIDINVWVLMVILWTVALISLLSILFICMVERKPYAAILGVMGARQGTLLRIFSLQAIFILGKGILFGNIVGLSICAFQYYTHVFELDQSVYFLSSVPIAFPWWLLLAANGLCLCLAALLLLLVSVSIGRKFKPIQDLKAI